MFCGLRIVVRLESFPQWNAQASYPLFIPNVKAEDFTRLPQLYAVIGNAFPDMPMSAYNTNFDENVARPAGQRPEPGERRLPAELRCAETWLLSRRIARQGQRVSARRSN
jgi:hypothetical protein